MNKHVLWIALSSMLSLTAMAGTTAAPDQALQDQLTTYQDQNLNDAYTAGTAYQMSQSYTAAANLATTIANTDTLNQYSVGDPQAWLDAATQATSTATAEQNLSGQELLLQQPAITDGNTTSADAANLSPEVAQSGAANGNAAASQDFASQTATIQSQTGISSGQIVPSSDVSYALAGAAEQALMNGLSTSGYQANVDAYTAYVTAVACSAVPGCSAAYMSINAADQSTADANYSANVAAAPVLADVVDVAALTAATTDAQNLFQQIASMTGVQQGVAVASAQAPITVSTNTSYTNAANTDWNTMQTADTQNLQATLNAGTAWQADSAYQTSADTANQIAGYDEQMASQQSTGSDTYTAWIGAANVALQAAGEQQTAASAALATQQQNIDLGNSSYTTSYSVAPSVGTELDSAASTAASTDAVNVLQQIYNATGN